MNINSYPHVGIAEGVGIPWVPLQALERLVRVSLRLVWAVWRLTQAAWRLLWATRRLTQDAWRLMRDSWRLQLDTLRLAGPSEAGADLFEALRLAGASLGTNLEPLAGLLLANCEAWL